MSLGRQPPPKPTPARRNLLPIRGVVADRPGQLGHVGAGRLAHLGHRVDERDLGGQERVGGHLDQLGGGEVGDHDRHLAVLGDGQVEHALVRRRTASRSAHSLFTPTTIRLGRSTSSTAKPSCRNSGLHATSTPSSGWRAGATSCSIHSAVPTGTVDLPTMSALRLQVRGEVGDRALDVGQVGGHAVGPLRGAHADEVDVAEVGDLLVGGGEAQPAGRQVLAQQLVQAGLVERHLAARTAWRSSARRCRSRAPRSPVRRSRSRRSRRGSRCRGRSAAAVARRRAGSRLRWACSGTGSSRLVSVG